MVIVSTVCETLFRVVGAQNMDSICDFHGVTTISKFLHMQNCSLFLGVRSWKLDQKYRKIQIGLLPQKIFSQMLQKLQKWVLKLNLAMCSKDHSFIFYSFARENVLYQIGVAVFFFFFWKVMLARGQGACPLTPMGCPLGVTTPRAT